MVATVRKMRMECCCVCKMDDVPAVRIGQIDICAECLADALALLNQPTKIIAGATTSGGTIIPKMECKV